MSTTAFLVDRAFRHKLHDQLRRQRKMALRPGRLAERGEWQREPSAFQLPREGSLRCAVLGDEHSEPDMRQTQVDMTIGSDIAALACKKQVDQIILVAGAAGFIPAATLARCEGIDFILDPMGQGIAPDLHEHIDGRQSVCPRPIRAASRICTLPSPRLRQRPRPGRRHSTGSAT